MRRAAIQKQLEAVDAPQSGTSLGKLTGVSRQIIVQDISILKAGGLPIVSTPTGYILVKDQAAPRFSRIIESCHDAEDIEEELFCIVDCGVVVKDVKVKHPLYGFIAAPMEISNRSEVRAFLKRMKETNAVPLSSLTEKNHYHTLEADQEAKLDEAIQLLQTRGFAK